MPKGKNLQDTIVGGEETVIKVTLLSWLLLHSVAHRCGLSTTGVLQETRCHSAPHHLDHLLVFKGLLLRRLLGPYPGGQGQLSGNLHLKKQKGILIQIPGDHTWRNSRFRLNFVFRSKAADQINSQVSFPPASWFQYFPLFILCPLALLTLAALVSYNCLLSFNLSNKFHCPFSAPGLSIWSW